MDNSGKIPKTFTCEEATLLLGCFASDCKALANLDNHVESAVSKQAKIIISAASELRHEGAELDADVLVKSIVNNPNSFVTACDAFDVQSPVDSEQQAILSLRLHKVLDSLKDIAVCSDIPTEAFETSMPSSDESAGSALTISPFIPDSDGWFHYENPAIKVEPLISINGVPVIAKGNLHFVIGAKKTFKSHVAIKMAGAVLGAGPDYCIGMERSGEPCKVLHIDTEQDDADLRELIISMLSQAGRDTTVQQPDYKVKALRGKTPEFRLKDTLDAIDGLKPGLVIIDGLVDLVGDFNDSNASMAVLCKLFDAANANRCAIVCVLHSNPRDHKARGHLGTILMQKAWGGLVLNQEGNFVKVSNKGYCRKESISEFQIGYSSDVNDVVKSSDMFRTADEEHNNYIISLFNKTMMLKRAAIIDHLMTAYGIEEKNKTKASRWFDKAVDQKVIKKRSDGMYELCEPVASFDDQEDMPLFGGPNSAEDENDDEDEA